jgi:hypothetical protein
LKGIKKSPTIKKKIDELDYIKVRIVVHQKALSMSNKESHRLEKDINHICIQQMIHTQSLKELQNRKRLKTNGKMGRYLNRYVT